MFKNLKAIQNEEKQLKTEFFKKTDFLISHILVNIPSDTIIHVEGKEMKVIYGPNNLKSLLFEKRPLGSYEDYEWIVDNIPALISAIEELEKKQAAEIILIVEKTRKAIEKVEKLQTDLAYIQ